MNIDILSLKEEILQEYPFIDFSNFDFSNALEKAYLDSDNIYDEKEFKMLVSFYVKEQVHEFIKNKIKTGDYKSILNNFFRPDIDFFDVDSCFNAFCKFEDFLIDISLDDNFLLYIDMLESSSNLKKTVEMLELKSYKFTDISNKLNLFLQGAKVIEEDEEYIEEMNTSPIDLERDLLNQLFNNKNSKRPPATREEEIEYFKKIRTGDEASRLEFLERNYALVLHFASKKSRYTSLAITDLFQEGFFGLNRAVDLFDSKKGFKFSTYASIWIENYIMRAIEKYHYVKIPAGSFSLFCKYKNTVETLSKKLGRDPKISEVAKEINIDEEKLYLINNAFKDIKSFDEPLCQSRQISNLEDINEGISELFIEATDNSIPMIEKIEGKNIGTNIKNIIKANLSTKQYEVIRLRYGIDNEEPMTQSEIGKLLGITRQAVADAEQRGILRLLNSDAAIKLAEYCDYPEKTKNYIKKYKNRG